MSAAIVHVVAAAIFNHRGEVLLARRPEHVHQGGLWEFPGGKVEPGEAVSEALARELDEELAIKPEKLRRLIRIDHDYTDKTVRLDVWRVDRFSGPLSADQSSGDEFIGREGQPLCWVPLHCLSEYQLPAANAAIVKALCLPATYLLTPEPGHDHGQFLLQLGKALEQGVTLLRLRAWALDKHRYQSLALQVLALCRDYQARLLLSGELEWVLDCVDNIGADGLHLSSQQLLSLTRQSAQRPIADDIYLAASCHNRRELEQALMLGVDFISLSPVLKTRSHPQAQPLGWAQFRALTEQVSIPVYALGGMTRAHVEQAWQEGGQGIAAVSSLWAESMNPGETESHQ